MEQILANILTFIGGVSVGYLLSLFIKFDTKREKRPEVNCNDDGCSCEGCRQPIKEDPWIDDYTKEEKLIDDDPWDNNSSYNNDSWYDSIDKDNKEGE